MDTLDNVDFTFVWPVGTIGPEGWPSAAPNGHVDGIKDDETTVEDVAVVETDRLAVTRDGRGCLDAQDGIAGAVDLDELVVPSIFLVLVVDGAVSGIGEGPEVPTVKEAIALLEDWRRLNSARGRRHGRDSHL